jgi:DNA-binding NarL/FixJ family response regulator
MTSHWSGPGCAGSCARAPGSRWSAIEVLRLVGRGLANSEIAGQLYISEVTVKAHLGHVLTKLGLRDRAAAIVYAFDTGLASPGG